MTSEPSNAKDKLWHPHNLIGLRYAENRFYTDRKVALAILSLMTTKSQPKHVSNTLIDLKAALAKR